VAYSFSAAKRGMMFETVWAWMFLFIREISVA
jgi:hypothetical protein